MITQLELKEILNYDLETGDWTWLKHFHSRFIGKQAGSVKKSGYRTIKINGKDYMSARLACLYVKGRWPIEEMDHIDTDASNDKWLNLREATKAENTRNRKAKSTSLIGFKGVKLSSSGKYEAAIGKGQSNSYKYLGSYNTPEEAAKAYAEEAKLRYGEFARYD